MLAGRATNDHALTWGFWLERVKGIEPSLSVWELDALARKHL